ncbi:MAG: hypothetical protein ACPKM0_06035 [Pleomorphochaeta sp.]
MNKFRKKIILILMTLLISLSSLLAQTVSFNISKGDINSLSIYNEFGKKMLITSNSNIPLNGKTIFRTKDKNVTIDYEYGTLEIFDNSIVVINPFESEPIIYLIDGQITLETDSLFVEKYQILSPVSKYEFNSPAKINVISNEDLEYGVFYQGYGTSYNALTNQTTNMESAQFIDMKNKNNIKIDIPSDYLNASINLESNDDLVNLIRAEYAYKEQNLLKEYKTLSEQLRTDFLNANYLLGIKPIQKSNNFDDITTINFIVTGNGQGNVSNLDLPSLSGIINSAKKNNENILLIDAGNTLRGSTFVNFDNGKTASQILDMIGYDIFVPGAVDFSNGINNLQQYDMKSNINFISSNAMNEEDLFYFNPFGLYLYDNFKIAVLGLSSPSDLTSINGVKLTDEIVINNAQKAINEANEVADYVILVSNLRCYEYNSEYILNNLTGINLFIDGNNNDAHLVKINGVPTLTTGVGYSEIQNYKLNVRDTEIISTHYAKTYSSNLNEIDNGLLTSLNLETFERDVNLQNYLSLIKIPDNLSEFLISPLFTSASTTLNNVQITNKISLEYPTVPEIPSFIETSINDKTNISEVPNQPQFKAEVKVEEINNIAKPKFKPISYKVKKQEMLIVDEEAVTQEEESTLEKEDETEQDESTVVVKKANIYTGEDLKIKTHVGLDTSLNINADVKDSTFVNNDYYGNLTIYPYISHGGFSFALQLSADMDDSFAISTDLYPFPSTTEEITEYVIDIVDHFKWYTDSDKLNLDLNRDEFNNTYDSAISYNELGGDTLHFNLKFAFDTTSIYTSLSNVNIYDPLNDTTEENVSINVDFNPVDIFKIKLGAIGIGNSSSINVYPSLNFDFIPVNNKDIQLKLNLGATTYFSASPTVNFQTILNPSSTNLIPNYLANTSIAVSSETLSLSLGANYLVTEDSDEFTTNMIHKATTRTIFYAVDTNTLSFLANLGYENDKIDLSLYYTIPFDASDFSYDNDLLDLDLSFIIDNFTLGGYLLYNDFIEHVKSISDISSFIYNADAEYGGYITYDLNNLSLTTSVTVPESTTTPLKLSFYLNYKLDFEF